jgi:hypothetical protein
MIIPILSLINIVVIFIILEDNNNVFLLVPLSENTIAVLISEN